MDANVDIGEYSYMSLYLQLPFKYKINSKYISYFFQCTSLFPL